jgi:uroporphyrinogen-III synthase
MQSGHARSLPPSSPPLAGERDAESLRKSGINQPLAGLNILVTRPRDQAQALALSIEQAGGTALLFPLLEIAPVDDTQNLQQQISRLNLIDLAIFISPNAVQYGMDAISKFGTLPQALKIATIGQGSAKALHEYGVNDIIAPRERFDSEGLLALLPHVDGWRVMIFRGDGGRELLGDTLKARGATVEYVTCYRRNKPQGPASTLLQADAITVTSSEALKYLHQMLASPEYCQLLDTPLFAPHPRIVELARELGWTHTQLTDAGDAGLLSELMQYRFDNSDTQGAL